ncbi:hypothetical protein [Cupriavidus sp. CuC1]|uniref:hypothetical protein n=1 Tax=Cupriavidus sp. CuC1 TaxID=3373131 RepID=UPI0037D74DD5
MRLLNRSPRSLSLTEPGRRFNERVCLIANDLNKATSEATSFQESVNGVLRVSLWGPCLLNVVPGGRTPITNVCVAEDMVYKITILPGLIIPAIEAADAALADLKSTCQLPVATASSAETLCTRRS